MDEFQNSDLDALYGPSRYEKPTMPGEINWKQVAIYSGIIILTSATTGLCVYVVMAKQNNQILAEIRSNMRAMPRIEAPREETIN